MWPRGGWDQMEELNGGWRAGGLQAEQPYSPEDIQPPSTSLPGNKPVLPPPTMHVHTIRQAWGV